MRILDRDSTPRRKLVRDVVSPAFLSSLDRFSDSPRIRDRAQKIARRTIPIAGSSRGENNGSREPHARHSNRVFLLSTTIPRNATVKGVKKRPARNRWNSSRFRRGSLARTIFKFLSCSSAEPQDIRMNKSDISCHAGCPALMLQRRKPLTCGAVRASNSLDLAGNLNASREIRAAYVIFRSRARS